MGACDADGCTALHVAAACGRAEAACLLLSLPDADVRMSRSGCKSQTCISRTVLRAAPRTVFCAWDQSLPAARLNAVRAWPAEGMETLGRAVRGCGSLIWRARLHALPTIMTIG